MEFDLNGEQVVENIFGEDNFANEWDSQTQAEIDEDAESGEFIW